MLDDLTLITNKINQKQPICQHSCQQIFFFIFVDKNYVNHIWWLRFRAFCFVGFKAI